MGNISCIQNKGRYLYGVTAGDKGTRLGAIGINGSEVYTIPYKDISAIVHSCSTEPYRSTDGETVRNWIRIHQSVLDTAAGQLGVIIPLGFDTILETKDDTVSPDQTVRDWLRQDYARLREVMRRVAGKNEYVVQVSYAPRLMARQILEKSEEVREIRAEMAAKSPGVAYLYRQKIKRVMRTEAERLADEWFKAFYGRIKKHTDDIVFEKTRRLSNGQVMLLNLSCLVDREKINSLGNELEQINNMEGFFVYFSGPWPPYSFVARPVVMLKGE